MHLEGILITADQGSDGRDGSNYQSIAFDGDVLTGSELFVTERPNSFLPPRSNSLLFRKPLRMRTLTNSRAEPDFHGLSFPFPHGHLRGLLIRSGRVH